MYEDEKRRGTFSERLTLIQIFIISLENVSYEPPGTSP